MNQKIMSNKDVRLMGDTHSGMPITFRDCKCVWNTEVIGLGLKEVNDSHEMTKSRQ